MENKIITYFVKDNIWTKYSSVTCSSYFLAEYYPNKNSFLKNILDFYNNEFKFLGKCDLDELSCGWTGLLSNKKITNPYDENRIIGGSSSESSLFVAIKKCHFSIATDTGGSILLPSSYSGIIGFKPSYSSISRYGVVPLSSSFDTIGLISLDIDIIKKSFLVLNKADENDLLTFSRRKFYKSLPIRNFSKKIILIKDLDFFLKKDIKEKYFSLIEYLKKEGYLFKYISLPEYIKNGISLSYYIISCSEAFSHFNSLQGVTFGIKKNLEIKKKRSLFLGDEIKRRLLSGAFFLSEEKMLKKAKKIRFLINNWINQIFKIDFSFIIFPTVNHVAPEISNISDYGVNIDDDWVNNLFLLANFSGIPSINLPFGRSNNLPFGLTIMSFHNEDEKILNFSNFLHKFIKFY